MTSKDQLIQMINNLNENGIKSLLYLFGDFDKIKIYNINTSPERMAELQQIKQIEKQQDEQRKSEREEKELLIASEREQLKKKYHEEFKMIGSQTDFWNQREILDAIDKVDRYDSAFMKIVSSYNWGYIQGVRAERKRRKKSSTQRAEKAT